MGASLTVYCLEKVTDYLEFERLCHDLMALEGYSAIEPLGGFSDKGRDAIHVNRSTETISVFAYSVREDWRAKLAEDASKIKRHDHSCDELVFITTASFTSGERDEAIATVKHDYGWHLELYGVERLRILLDAKHPHVKEQHPHVFPPAFLLTSVQNDMSARNDLFLSAAPEDEALTDWLTRKLTAEGFSVWNERLNFLGGESYLDNVDTAIRKQAFRMLGLYSQASLKNPEVMRQRALAINIGHERNIEFLIPLNVDKVELSQLDRVTSSLTFIPFENWGVGLHQLLKKLESINCPKVITDGRRVAAEVFLEKDILTDQTELVFSNCLPVEQLPRRILLFKPQSDIPDDQLENLYFEWVFRRAGNLFLSFQKPPNSVSSQLLCIGNVPWQKMQKIEGIDSGNLVSELLRKALIIKCHEKGLVHCPDTKLHYFPLGLLKNNRISFSRPDGSKTHVLSVGQRKFPGADKYRYHLAPTFKITQNISEGFQVLVRIKIRLTDTYGQVLSRRTAISRRKHLCKDWWNYEWFSRLFAICRYLADDQGKIKIGSQQDQIVISAMPIHLYAPIGINETALAQLSLERLQLIQILQDDDEESDEVGNEDD